MSFNEEINYLKNKLKQVKMKTSKVKSVQPNGTYDSQYGVDDGNGNKIMYKFEYEMEDGTVMTAGHKTVQSPFNIGDTVEYEILNTNFNSGSVKKPQEQFNSNSGGGNFSPSKERQIVLQSCLKASASYYAERSEGTPEVVFEQAKIWRDLILNDA